MPDRCRGGADFQFCSPERHLSSKTTTVQNNDLPPLFYTRKALFHARNALFLAQKTLFRPQKPTFCLQKTLFRARKTLFPGPFLRDELKMNMNTGPQPLKIVAVIFPGFELLDIYGPLEMFGMLQDRIAITMAAEKAGEIKSSQGPKAVADIALADAKGFDILLVPGGRGIRTEIHNAAFLDALRARAGEARFVAGVCTGGALLARAGVLDGRRATSNKQAFDWVSAQGPGVTWVREARWVEDGRFFTSSGVSAGMDMALGLIAHLFDRETSRQAARRAEYVWNEDKSLDPFARPAV